MLLIALGLLLQANDQGQLVTAEQEARVLSSRLGHELVVAKPLRSEMLYVASHGATPEIEAKAVAEALHASLDKNGAGWLIQRTKQQRLDIERDRRTERATWIRRAIKDRTTQRTKKLAGHSAESVVVANLNRALKPQTGRPTTQAEDVASDQGLYDCELLLPGATLLESIVARLTPERLASIPSGDYRVYETDPILPAEALPDVSDLVASFTRSMHAFEGSPLAVEMKERSVGAGGAFLTGFGGASKPVKTRLMVTTSLTGLTLSLELFDEVGSRIGVASMFISRPDISRSAEIEARKPGVQGHPVWIPVSDAATKCASFRSRKGEFPDWFRYPERTEPLSIISTTGFAWMAEQAPEKCFVVDMPDSVFSMAMQVVKQDRLNVSAFQVSLAGAEMMQQVSDDHAVVWRSRDPEWVEITRSDRKALGSFSRGVISAGWIDPREEGLVFHRCRQLNYDWRAAARLGLEKGNGRPQISPSGGELMPIIGEISDADWQSLRSGRTITVGELGIVHETALLLSLEPDVVGGNALSDLFRHPLEMYGRYRIEETPVSLKGQPEQVVQVKTDSFVGDWCPLRVLPAQLTHDGLGVVRNRKLTRDTLEAYLEEKCSFNVGQRSELTMIVGLPQGHSIEQRLLMPVETVSSKLPYSQMPKEIRDKVWELFSRRGTSNRGG